MTKTKLITPDIIKMVQASCNSGAEIVKYSMDCPRRFAIGRVMVIKNPEDKKALLYLDDTCTKDYMSVWRSDVGGILLKELRHCPIDLYELRDDKFKCLMKKVRDDEMEMYSEGKLIHVNIADSHYSIIKIIKKDSDYMIKDFYNDYEDDFNFVSVETSDDEIEMKKIEKEVANEIEQQESFELF